MAYDPFVNVNPLVHAAELHRGRLEQTRENSARYAQAMASISTVGDGRFIIDEPTIFDTVFLERPIVSYGSVMDPRQLVDYAMPRAHGGVRDWVRNERGHYIGAYVYLTVQTDLDPGASRPADGTTFAFSDGFDRPASTTLGRGWVCSGGDFQLEPGRAFTYDANAFMGQAFGRRSLSVAADLTTTGTAQPCVYAWGRSQNGYTGYRLVFNPSITEGNIALYRAGALLRLATVPSGLGGSRRLRLNVALEDSTVTVTGLVDEQQTVTFAESLSAAPTGLYSGAGSAAGAGETSVTGVVMGLLVSGQTAAPSDPEPALYVPRFLITHDFSFTEVAYKLLPEYLLDDTFGVDDVGLTELPST